MKSLILEELSWVQAENAFREVEIVLVPIGAILKEHGPHLPLNTDFLLARDLARRVAEQTPVLVCSPVPFGYYPAFVDFPGSTHLAADTFREMVEQIITSLAAHGARRFLILNTGISTTAPLTIAANNLIARGMRVALAHIADLGHSAEDVLENTVGSHANEHETSMLLAIDPALVRMELAVAEIQPWMLTKAAPVREPGPLWRARQADVGYAPSGVIGDPTRATREKGELILSAMAREIVAFCKKWTRPSLGEE